MHGIGVARFNCIKYIFRNKVLGARCGVIWRLGTRWGGLRLLLPLAIRIRCYANTQRLAGFSSLRLLTMLKSSFVNVFECTTAEAAFTTPKPSLRFGGVSTLGKKSVCEAPRDLLLSMIGLGPVRFYDVKETAFGGEFGPVTICPHLQ